MEEAQPAKKDWVEAMKQNAFLRANIVSGARKALEELQEELFENEGRVLSEAAIDLLAQEIDKEAKLGTSKDVIETLRMKVFEVARLLPDIEDKKAFADMFVGRLKHQLALLELHQ